MSIESKDTGLQDLDSLAREMGNYAPEDLSGNCNFRLTAKALHEILYLFKLARD
jgi:hypothetical protein